MDNQIKKQFRYHDSRVAKQVEQKDKEKEEYYKYLDRHNFTELNFPFSSFSFLKKNGKLFNFEEGAAL